MINTLKELYTYYYKYDDNPDNFLISEVTDVTTRNALDDDREKIIQYLINIESDSGNHGKSKSQLVLNVPADTNSLVTTGTKDRVQITSGFYDPMIRDFNGLYFKIRNAFFKFESDDSNYIELQYPGNYAQPKKYLNFFSVLKYLGILTELFPDKNPGEVPTLKPEDIESLVNFEVDQGVLDKIEIMSKGEHVFKENKLTADLVKFLVKTKLEDKLGPYGTKIPTDYRYMKVIDGLANEIRANWRVLRNSIRYNYNQYGWWNIKDVQNVVNRYFNMQALEFRNVQVPKNSNAVSMMSQAKRIYFYETDRGTGKKEKTAIYNNYFIGVVDPVRTSDSALININNELTNDTEIKNEGLLIRVYDKDFNEHKISYAEYSRSGVLLSDYINYDDKNYFMKDGIYTYMKYSKYYTTTNADEFKYLKTKENRLSPATSCIPFLNRMVPTRSLLSSHFLDQSIPVVGAKPAPVHTTANSSYYKKSPYNTKTDVDGEVVAIYNNMVKVKDDEGNIHLYGDGMISENTSSHTTNEYYTTVKVGDKVKKNDVLVAMNSFVDNEFTTSVPLYVMYGTYLGHEHEDGIILTESAAKKFAHVQHEDITRNIKNGFTYDSYVDNKRFDKFGFIKENEVINPGDVLFSYYEYLPEDDSRNKLIYDIQNSRDRRIELDDNHLIRLKTKIEVKAQSEIRSGIVTGIDVIFGEDTSDIPTDFIDYWRTKAEKDAEDYKKFTGKKKISDYTIDPDTKVMVIIHIRYLNTMEFNRLSGKLSNYYASKGVNTYIIPDEETPHDELGNKIECIIQALTLYGRKNPGQVAEVKLGLIALEGYKFLKSHSKDDPKVKEFLETLYPRGYDYRQCMNDGSKYGYIRILADPFDTYYTPEVIQKLLTQLNLGDGNFKVYFPKIGKWTATKNTVGLSSIMRLHFLQEKKGKASGELDTAEDINLEVGYQNSINPQGQKIGSQEVWAYMGHGKQQLLNDMQEKYDTKLPKFQASLLMLGLKLDSDVD